MSHIFVSYSRKDIKHAGRLVEALAENDLDAWVDWKSIPKGEDWWEHIQNGIEEADAFLFLISPDSISSRVCNDELNHAVTNGKRILPIIIRDPKIENVPEVLSKLNWIFCRDDDDFDKAIAETRETVQTDYEWLKFHTELQVKALKWHRRGNEKSLLLRGRELEDAESMVGLKAGLEPYLVHLQREYLLSSRQAVNRQRRQITIGLGLGFILMAILAVFAWGQRNSAVASEATAIAEGNAKATALANEEAALAIAQVEKERAEEQAQISRAGELAAQSISYRDKDFQLSLLLGIHSYQTFDTLQSKSVLLENVLANDQLRQYLTGHTEGVQTVAFDPDGKRLASSSWDGIIILWNLETGQQIDQPNNSLQNDLGVKVVFSPNSKKIASVIEGDTIYSNNPIILLDRETSQPIGPPLTGHAFEISSIAFSQDSKIIAYGSFDNSITIWDVESQKPKEKILTEYTSGVINLVFSPDSKRLASSGWRDNFISIWDVETGRLIDQIFTNYVGIHSLAFSPDGKTIAYSGDNKSIIIWDVASKQSIREIITDHNQWASMIFTFSPNGKILASTSSGDTLITLWDVETGQPIDQPLTGHTGGINGIAFSPDGKALVSCSDDKTIILWSIDTQQDIKESPYDSNGRSIILWDVESRVPLSQPFTGEVNLVHTVAFSPDGKTLASIDDDNFITLWDVESQQRIGIIDEGITDSVTSLAFSPNGQLLASGIADNTISLWNVESQQPIRQQLRGHNDRVNFLTFSPDGKILASVSSNDRTTNLWNVEDGEMIWQLPVPLYNIAFSPDGKLFAGCGQKCALFEWESRQFLGELGSPPFEMPSVAFSPDGKTIATGSIDQSIVLWDVESLQALRQPLTGHTGSVLSLAFSPNGKTLASGSSDNSIFLWDVETGQPIGQIRTGITEIVNAIAFSPDGNILLSGSLDNNIILWNMNPYSWIEKTCQRVGRNLTQAEWNKFFFGTEYQVTCPQWLQGE